MISTKNILIVIKRELFYQWYSKKILMILLILLALVATHLLGLHNAIVSNYNMYKITEQSYINDGISILEALRQDNLIYVDGNISVSNNPIKNSFINLSISIQNLNSSNILSNTLEYIVFVFCTLIFGIYASYIATYDFKYKTYKFISTRYNQIEIIIGKIISAIIIMVITIGVALLITYISSFLVYSIVQNKVPINQFTIEIFNYENSLPSQLLLTFLVLVFYIIMGFSIGFILKNMVFPTIVLLLYGLIIPILGAYDFRNIFSYFAHSVFSFNGRFNMFAPMPINNVVGIAIILLTSILILFSIFIVINKRSAYN